MPDYLFLGWQTYLTRFGASRRRTFRSGSAGAAGRNPASRRDGIWRLSKQRSCNGGLCNDGQLVQVGRLGVTR